ncbi:activating signal cointegrator 1 [Iris pallida]|uniref:Activating signal cointegrator 1 n=1 Tax=Iris pallida TaxID=29817 RepID=A0AAX6HR03_IRIPA|nr:activating signal cointegrator 1 [Iris pallida]KAJ6843430.1 activating signal cointegrator 1 [Iris pallida]
MGSAGEWLERALSELCGKMETGLDLDADLISGLVSFCELAPPPDAAEYLTNIIGLEAGQSIIQEYLHKRGYSGSSMGNLGAQTSSFQAYVKPSADKDGLSATKKQTKAPKEETISVTKESRSQVENAESRNNSRGTSSLSKKKKAGKVISLAEAAKGSVVFQQGKPCSCQARRHKLVSNCLSCGKIVCEQEGEGPCSFCGALVLREGSTYAGLDDFSAPASATEAAAEAYAKRLVDYDRNSAARTTVIDDQSDYYEIEGNSWLSGEEKDRLRMKQKEIEEANEARKGKVIVTFDLLGRKVLVDKDDAEELDSEYRILRPEEEREQNRIKPNPTIKVQPVFANTGFARHQAIGKQHKRVANGLCLEISGRVQHDGRELSRIVAGDQKYSARLASGSQAIDLPRDGDAPECSLDYN